MTARTVLIAHPGAELYGSDRMVIASLRALTGDGSRAVLVVPRSGPLVDAVAAEGYTVLICPTPVISKAALGPRGLLNLLRATARALLPGWRLLGTVRPDVVLVNTLTPPLWLLLARLRGIPAISHVHEGEASASPLVRRLLYLPLVLATSVVVNSQFSLSVLASAAPWLVRRSSVVLNAVEGPPQVVAPREHVVGDLRLLFVGRLSARKGPHVAIEAVSILRDRGVPAVLELLGSASEGYEWYEEQLRAAVEAADLQSRVRFLGFRPDIWDVVAAADVVVVPSTVDEPFGNTAVEARLAARPLVVSDISGLREASAGTGAVRRVPPADPSALADAVEFLLAGWSDQRQRAVSGARDASVRFSHERYALELRAAVDRLPEVRR